MNRLVGLSSATSNVTEGTPWVFTFATLVDGVATDETVTAIVQYPDGSTGPATVTSPATGVYRAWVDTTMPGRYVAEAAAVGYGSIPFAAHVTAITLAAGMPDVDAVSIYLGPTSATEADMQDALDAESAAQRSVCEVPAAYPADLRQALLRRVARNLVMRGLPVAVLQGDGDVGNTILPGNDPEVRRFEGPHRRWAVG